MIRRIVDFIFVLFFVWICMLAGLLIIDRLIVPLQIPGISNEVFSSALKVLSSTALVLLWLWIWRELIRKSFWRAIKKHNGSFIDESKEKQEEQ